VSYKRDPNDGRYTRYLKECRNGHPRTPENTKIRTRYIECLICLKERELHRSAAARDARNVTLASVLADTTSPEVYQLVMECWNEGHANIQPT
jgi:hypothetical protein